MQAYLVTIAILTLVGAAWAQPEGAGVRFCVSPDGSDEAPGTEDEPFATLERARDAIREQKQAEGLPGGGATVRLAEGTYRLNRTLELNADDGGGEDAPVVYRAAPGASVRISGGVRVPPAAFGPADEAAAQRLPEEAREHVVRADLKALGVEDFGSAAGGGAEVFFGDRRMTLARWPNEGFTRIKQTLGIQPKDVRGRKGDSVGKFVYDGDRPQRWVDEPDLWLHGYWFWDWADQRQRVTEIDTEAATIELEEPYHHYGYREGQWYYAYNALSELDEPGEWYIDREAGVLYLWPPAGLDEAEVTVSAIDDLITISDASWVSFEGVAFEAARRTGIVISGGAHDSIIGCSFRDIGGFAARASGTGHRIAHCDAYYLGHGGFAIDGGDRETLTPGGNEVENCHIHHFGEWKRMYVPGVSVRGVGNRVAHNLIHTAPHQAIAFYGNEHVIELNEMHSVCFESNDAGAIYAGRDWTTRGTVIRHNYMHHVNGREGRGCVGVYLDDMWCGTEISGNLFYRVIRAAFIGGGRDNSIVNNIFVECPKAIHIDARAMGWASASVEGTMTTRLNAMPYTEPPWSERYPELLRILEDEPAAPKGNVVTRNVIVGPYRWEDVQGAAKPYQTIEGNLIDEDPLFVDADNLNFRLRADSPAWELGFEPIPIERIGLYEHPARPTWPVGHQVKPSVIRYWREKQEASLQPRPARTPRPERVIARLAAAVEVDGMISPEEWSGAKPEDAMVIEEGIHGERTAPPSRAWLYHDGEHLVVAIENQVDGSKPLRPGDTWGQDDAVEIALRGPGGPILVLRGYPSGHFESSNEAGAPPEAVERAGLGVVYAASIAGADRWTCEWRIPLASLGIELDPAVKLDFNISVRKTAQPLWQMWHGTGAHTWDVQDAGIVTLAE